MHCLARHMEWTRKATGYVSFACFPPARMNHSRLYHLSQTARFACLCSPVVVSSTILSVAEYDNYWVNELLRKEVTMALFRIILPRVTFSIPCILIQLLQFEPMNAHNFIEVTVILQHTSSYMFRASLAHHEGAHSCIKQLLNFPIEQLFCTIMCSLMMGHWGPKHVAASMLYYYCDFNKITCIRWFEL
jgi:hypothetical protein